MPRHLRCNDNRLGTVPRITDFAINFEQIYFPPPQAEENTTYNIISKSIPRLQTPALDKQKKGENKTWAKF